MNAAAQSASRVESIEEGRFIVVSTAHITQEDSELLKTLAAGVEPTPLMMSDTRYGFVVSLVPGSDRNSARTLVAWFRTQGLSESFVTLWKGMRARGYGLLQLDADATTLVGYDTFSW